MFENMKNFFDFNQFNEKLKQFTHIDYSKSALIAKNNAEAFSQIGQLAMKNTHAYVKKNVEVAQKSAEDFQNLFKIFTSPNAASENTVVDQQQQLKNVVHSNINHSKELVDMAVNSNIELYNIVHEKIDNNINEYFKEDNFTRQN